VASTEGEATFSIDLDADGADQSAERLASSVESLRDKIIGSQESIKAMSGALRNLRGSSDEVKSAKEQLKAKISAEKDALGVASLAAVKSGQSLDKFTSASKRAAEAKAEAAKKAASLGEALKAAGGPLASLKDKFETLQKLAGGSGALALFAVGAVAATVALLKLAQVAVGLAMSFGQFVIQGANAARTANLFREAATGSATNATALGQQIDLLSASVSTSREELNELGDSLAKSGVTGKTLVDTLNAVAQANDALGSDAGGKLRSIIEQGRISQRFFANRESFVGTGITFDDVAGELAKSLKVGIGDAKKAIAEGRVKLSDGAEALRLATEKKLGKINASKMLDINKQVDRLKQNFTRLTEGVKLEPLLRGVDKLFSLFDENASVSGAALKQIVTIVGSGMSAAFEKSTPIVTQLFKGMVIGTLTAIVSFLKFKKSFTETFGDVSLFKNVDGLALALKAGSVAASLFAGFIIATAAGAAALAVGFGMAVVAVSDFGTWVESTYNGLKSMSWSSLGLALVQGFVTGITSGSSLVIQSITSMTDVAKKTVVKTLGIGSPAKKMKPYGKNTAEGFAGGVDEGKDVVERSVNAMATPPAGLGNAAGGGGGGGGGGRAPVVVHVSIDARGATEKAVEKLQDPGVLAALIRAIEDGLVSQGALPAGAT
jgi:hypothetical protein